MLKSAAVSVAVSVAVSDSSVLDADVSAAQTIYRERERGKETLYITQSNRLCIGIVL